MKIARLGIYLLAFVCSLAALAVRAGTVTYFHNDIAGSPAVATNAAGAVIWRESYRPYGERTVNSAAALDNKVWFTSRRQDQDTGLVYMGARYYDPVIGRFVSTDPSGFDEKSVHSFNRYAYANNNPYRYTDPDGRNAAVVALAGGGALALLMIPGEKRRELGTVLFDAAVRLYNIMSESGQSQQAGERAAPAALPDRLVGTADAKSGPQGNRVNNGPLDPSRGGTGDAGKDFDLLTGGNSAPAPSDSSHPAGTRIGENGIALRPPRGAPARESTYRKTDPSRTKRFTIRRKDAGENGLEGSWFASRAFSYSVQERSRGIRGARPAYGNHDAVGGWLWNPDPEWNARSRD